jgi:hypothetical protein
LTTLKGDVDLGIKRVEAVLGSLEYCGLNAGSGEGQSLGRDKAVGCTDTKPKRKNRKKKKKNKKRSSGPKPGKSPVSGVHGAEFM